MVAFFIVLAILLPLIAFDFIRGRYEEGRLVFTVELWRFGSMAQKLIGLFHKRDSQSAYRSSHVRSAEFRPKRKAP